MSEHEIRLSEVGSCAAFNRRQWLLGALAASIPMLGEAQSQSAVQTLRIGYIGPGKKPAYATGWALQQGILQRELSTLGFSQVVTRVFPNGPDLNEAFIADHLDIGIYGDTPAVVAHAQGFQGKLLGFDCVGMNTWLLTPKAGIKTVEELKGKVVGVALGSYMHRFVLGLLRQHGLSGRVKVVHMLPRDGAPALERGDVAAFAAPINMGPLLAQQGFPVLAEAAQYPTLLGTSVIVISPKLLARLPQFPATWGRARSIALGEIRSDSAAYLAFHAEASGFPVPAVKASVALSNLPAQAYPEQGLHLISEAKRFLLNEKLVRKDFSVESWKIPGFS
ncbi:ABC transporter substrate-binding protein [Comamonas thiooxydans]|uniref:ABC transporter substrate-binding protein n=1 Tax=Comamonas thiooxydans TaxID=363952 RepID=UPI001CCAA269|nr:ABC transporter substrate-binding protein [Comamonas thiooxydans]UBQ42093.1 ABC transporter substrate-binding protein [Comamonas thiooxydans]